MSARTGWVGTFRQHGRRVGRRVGRRAGRNGLVAGIVVFLLLVGSGVSYAAWMSSANATTAASTASLSLTTSNFTSNAYTFKNHRLTTTGSVTIANTTSTTSTTVPGLSLAFTVFGGSPTLGNNLQLRVWPSSLGACAAGTSTPGAAIAGTWGSFPSVTTTLAKATSTTYCVRTFGAERGDLAASAGSAAITPRVAATLNVGNFVSTATATTTQDTQYIYPYSAPDEYAWYYIKSTVATTPCLDVFSNGTASGTPLIEWPCKTVAEGNLNQQWRFTSATGNYYDVHPRNTTSLRWDNGASTAEGAAVTVNTDAAGQGQEWQLQQVSAGVYQLVNNLSGLCLKPEDTSVTAAVEYAQTACDGTAAQRYTLTLAEAIPHLDSISCANTGASGTTRRVVYTWSPVATETYSVQYRAVGATGAWTQISTVASGLGTYTWVAGAGTPTSDGTYDVRVVAGSSTAAATAALATESVWKGTGSAGAYLRCDQPTPVIDTVSCANTGTTGTSRRVQYTWSPESTEGYSIQYRAVGATGNWTQISTVAAGVGTYTWIAGAGTPAADGTYDVRVVVGSSLTAATPALAVNSVWRGTGTGGAYLRCAQPTPAITGLACADTGASASTYRISYSWAEEVIGSYALWIQSAGGTWTNFGTITAGATSYAVNPSAGAVPLSWAVGTYNAKIMNGATELAAATFYRGGTTTPYLRCVVPPTAPVAMVCSVTGFRPQVARFDWAAQPAGTYRLQSRNASGDSWTTLATTTSTTMTTIDRDDFTAWGNGDKDVQLLNAASAVVGTGLFSVETSSRGTKFLGCG